jgi:hypothetical protein
MKSNKTNLVVPFTLTIDQRVLDTSAGKQLS